MNIATLILAKWAADDVMSFKLL